MKESDMLMKDSSDIRKNIDVLQGKHKDRPCVIIGTGPSILKINESYFSPDEIIIALNDSIALIERLDLNNIIYSMQKDAGIVRPKKAILLVSEHESKFAFENYSPRYIFDAIKLFDGKNYFMEKEISANCALKIVQLFGCSKIRLRGFDSCINGDVRHVGLDGTISRGQPSYVYHCMRIRNLIQQNKLDAEFIL